MPSGQISRTPLKLFGNLILKSLSMANLGAGAPNQIDLFDYKHFAQIGDPEIETTVAQQKLAFRMQASVPELTDISGEPKHVIGLYGPEVHKNGSFARNCLLARRMVERGVRFIQIFHRGWDHHTILPKQMPGQCFDVDQPSAVLLG